ncbi:MULTISPECIES: hypothetical protein [unclassified Lactococcus]|uniref:hypothetical protein n=1 Tax=unclassified Lactococcus TaxID=2643510 RepID=UPI001430E2D1|nr:MULTISPECIES: hypothetical protein [unclassified Lactococcus]KAF6611224.1 hypothetical protein HFD74_01575 [Lactococcus sp. EKM201L]KAF6613890.1 hypothetical protein HFD15_02065 [Lactococcus sp. EKM203L]KAF6642215.1 hypothetical protein HFC73_06000 [Lactococcus sp. EKM501L]KAF6645744.1 hypothetical protein HFC72_05055 [Lactococcus sp. EKM502L]KAF6654237.1 hypothetical protein HFC74_01575 [Lactococcus sp. EKM101L]
MRLMKRDLITVYLRRATITQDEEFNDVIAWESPVALEMNVQSVSGAVNATIYGSKLSSMKSCKYQGDELKEGRDENSGICLYVDKDSDPDYKIKSIQPYSTHINVMLERND